METFNKQKELRCNIEKSYARNLSCKPYALRRVCAGCGGSGHGGLWLQEVLYSVFRRAWLGLPISNTFLESSESQKLV